MSDYDRHPALAGPGMMFLSAAIFGYFGFFMGLSHVNPLGQFVLFFALLDWTLKGAATGFVVAGILTFASPLTGNLIYSLCSIASTVLFVVVAAMDFLDQQHAAAIPPVLLLLFAAWNGYGSWSGLRTVLELRHSKPAARGTADFPGPE